MGTKSFKGMRAWIGKGIGANLGKEMRAWVGEGLRAKLRYRSELGQVSG
jgi:hypothetical protein